MDKVKSVFHNPLLKLHCPDFSHHFPKSVEDFVSKDRDWEKLVLVICYVHRVGEELFHVVD